MPLHMLRTLAFNRAAHSSTSGATRILYPMPASRTKHALTSTIASQADTLNFGCGPADRAGSRLLLYPVILDRRQTLASDRR